MQCISTKYLQSCEEALKKIRERIINYSVKINNDLVAWGQHIDKASSQHGIYGTSAAIEMIDVIDSVKSYNEPISEQVKKALAFLRSLILNEMQIISSEGSNKYQLAIIPKLSAILSCLSLRIIGKETIGKEIRDYVVKRLKASQNSDGGWPPYYPKYLDETCTEIPLSDPLITAHVLLAVAKSEAKDEINLQKAIEYLIDKLHDTNLPLHTQLYLLFSVRLAKPDIDDEIIKIKGKELIKSYDKAFPNILEIYHPFDVKDTKENKTTAHYFVVKQKTLFLHYLSKFEYNTFCTKKWFDRAVEAVTSLIQDNGGEKSKISLRIGTRNTLSATLFLVNSKKKVGADHRKLNFRYYATKILYSIKTRYIITAVIVVFSFFISPKISSMKDMGFFFGVLASIIASIIYSLSTGEGFWGKK